MNLRFIKLFIHLLLKFLSVQEIPITTFNKSVFNIEN